MVSQKRYLSVLLVGSIYDEIEEVDTVSLEKFVSVLVVVCLYNQMDEVDRASPTGVSVSSVELHQGGSATNGVTQSSLVY